MSDVLTLSVAGMQRDWHRMEVISQNMANVSTPGYKRDVPINAPFGSLFQTDMETDKRGRSMLLQSGQQQVTSTDTSIGPLQRTGKALDLALQGRGFFQVMTDTGPAYTRMGSFHIDASYRVVNDAGNPLSGLVGDISLTKGDVKIDSNGHFIQDGRVVGQLKVVRFENEQYLVKRADGLFHALGNANPSEVQPQVHVGFLEGSNVSPVREMTAMTETTRHFESLQKLYQNVDEQIGQAIQKLSEF